MKSQQQKQPSFLNRLVGTEDDQLGSICSPYTTRYLLAHLYESTGRAITVTTLSALVSASALFKMLKFLVKVFKSLYVLNPWMDLVDTLPAVRYWSEVLCCNIMTQISDLEVKVTDFKILS